MDKKKPMKKNNSGFSLIELVVSIAILAIVSAAIFEFVMVAIKHYQKETREVELQYEAQLAMNQLQDLLIDATKGVSYTVNGSTLIQSDGDIAGVAVTSKEITIYNTERYYVVTWKADQEKLFYSEYSRQADGTWKTEADAVLMADYVNRFSADLTFFERNNSIGLDILFDNDKDYRVMQNVKLRNQVTLNASRADLYGN